MAVADPAEAPAEGYLPVVDVERISCVEVRDRRNRQLVALIELLSPANKQPGSNRDQYLARRNEILAGPAHLVEIDLLRGGLRPPVERRPPCDYCILVSRSETRPRVGLWPVGLRERLPVIPIPLRAPDSDAKLDLQAAVHEIYDKARYQNYLYDGAPEPPLAADDAARARPFVPART